MGNTNGSTPSDTKGWIPTEDGDCRHPCVRGSERDAAHTGVARPYLPWFSTKADANAWCRSADCVATSCNFGEASRIAEAHAAELIEV